MIEQATEAFVLEANETLADLEGLFLSLEEDASGGRVDEIFRALHTIKGSGSMFGYTALSRFTHHFENAYELVRDGTLPVTTDLVDLSLKARDLMVAFIQLGGDGPPAEDLLTSPEATALVEKLSGLTGAKASPAATQTPKASAAGGETDGVQIYDVDFRPAKDALRNGMRPDLLLRELSDLGPCTVRYDTRAVPPLSQLDPADSVLGWRIRLETQAPRSAIDDVFIFADDADLTVTERAAETPSIPENAASPEPPAAQPSPQATRATTPARTDTRSESIRVTSSRLDDMMDSLGELVIAQTRLDSVAASLGDATLETVVEEVQRLVMTLRDATLSIRMLPIETVFGKFRRVVRDLSSEMGKSVQLVTEGGETEVDKNVIDRIGEPIVHMIRNSIDHGLETSEERRAAGKSPQGTVWLSASQEGGEILVSIEDNGRGLNADAIRARAVERGLIAADAELDEQDINQLIFEPGFSTAKQISAVSGRGVGMDAVKTTIDALGGSISVLSRAGRGSRITLRLPVTMAIIDGLRVRLGNSVYVIPLSAVEECVEMDTAALERASGGRSVLQIRDEWVPYVELDRLFDRTPMHEARRRVVVVRADGARIGLVVDDILGQFQTVVKSLSAYHGDIPGLGGATILGDGRVALIVDVVTLVRWAETKRADGDKEAA